MKPTFLVISKWISYLLLVCVMVGGMIVIMHDPSYELSDDTMVQTHIGIGRMHLMNEKPVFSPEEGRFFPLGYQHFNLLLLLSPSGVSANIAYAFDCVLWCVFLLLVFYACKISLPMNIEGAWRHVIPLCVVLIMAQRTLQFFTVLWTCSSGEFIILALAILVWYYYCRDKKYWKLGILVVLVTYYTFCGETNVVVPFMIGLCALLNINSDNKRDIPLILSMSGIVVLFVGLYMVLIYPYISASYDSAHGQSVSFMENALYILLNQKLLLLTIAIFMWRLFKVFVKKENFNAFSDTLLATSFAIMSANLILKLNYPIYYISAIMLSIPAFMQVLDFSTKTKRIISIFAVSLVTLYFIPKTYKLVQTIWQYRTRVCNEMYEFDNACRSNATIIWYMDNAEKRGVEDGWARGHVGSHLIYLGLKQAIEYTPDIISNLSDFLIVTPESHTLEDVLIHTNITEETIVQQGKAPSVKYYCVKSYKP